MIYTTPTLHRSLLGVTRSSAVCYADLARPQGSPFDGTLVSLPTDSTFDPFPRLRIQELHGKGLVGAVPLLRGGLRVRRGPGEWVGGRARTHTHTHTPTHPHTQTHTHPHTYTHKHIHTKVCAHTHTHTFKCMHIHMHMHMHMHTHSHAYKHKSMCTHMLTHTHTNACTHTHTHTHTCILGLTKKKHCVMSRGSVALKLY